MYENDKQYIDETWLNIHFGRFNTDKKYTEKRRQRETTVHKPDDKISVLNHII